VAHIFKALNSAKKRGAQEALTLFMEFFIVAIKRVPRVALDLKLLTLLVALNLRSPTLVVVLGLKPLPIAVLSLIPDAGAAINVALPADIFVWLLSADIATKGALNSATTESTTAVFFITVTSEFHAKPFEAYNEIQAHKLQVEMQDNSAMRPPPRSSCSRLNLAARNSRFSQPYTHGITMVCTNQA
jgi:hypothetical protein